MTRLVLGLDIGITSVGYGIIDLDSNSFVDYGIRLFKEAEKEGTAETNKKRRGFRGARRLKRRRTTRLNDMKKLLHASLTFSDDSLTSYDPYLLRIKGLTQKLTDEELAVALLHITKHRGSSLEVADEADSNDNGVTKEILAGNRRLLADGHYVCEIQYQRKEETGKIRGHSNNFFTDDYLKEAEQILSHQSLDEQTNKNILSIIARKRAYYDGPGSAISPTPYGRWIDFGVEPIDLIEKMRGTCSVFPDQPRAPKNSYTAELFNLLNDLNNLTVDNRNITPEEKERVIQFVNEKGNITVKQLAKLLNVSPESMQGFRIDKNNKPLLTEFKGYHQIKKLFDAHQDFSYVESKDIVDDITEILTKKKGIQERKDAILEQYPMLTDELIGELAELKGMTQYHALSFKAMRLLNEEMLQSEYNQMELLHQMELFGANRKSTKGQKNIFADDTAILSPVAKRAQRETFKVVNALRQRYGEFDSIVVETTRAKNSNEEKAKIKETQKYFENENKKVTDLLGKEGYDAQHINSKTKTKIRLYLQQQGKSAYTLKPIDLNELINDPTAYEIDHIIPLSISLDDSINNKALCTRTENQVKGNRTPVDAYLKGCFAGLGCDLHTYQEYVKRSSLPGKKKGYLLYEKDITKFSNIQEFIARNLVDTSYANRVVLNTLQNYFKDNDIPTKVHTIKGQATHLFRKRINFNKDREQDYLHHAMDALIVASIKKLNLLNTYLAKYNIDQLYDEQTGEIMKVEDEKAVLNPVYIEFIMQLKTIHDESFQYYNGLIKRSDMHHQPIKISHKIDTKPNRQVADKTIYSTRMVNQEEQVVKKYKDIYAPDFTALAEDILNGKEDKYLMYQHDPQTFAIIRDIVMDHFQTYQDDPDIYSKKISKTVVEYTIKGKNNPLSVYAKEHGKVRKYSKKGNGPEITMMKYLDSNLGNYIDITHSYPTKNKRVVLQKISPYRTDFYISDKGKYKFVTVRYCNVFYNKKIQKYAINREWYQQEKEKKGIDQTYTFICSMHHDELIGITKKDGSKYVYDLSTEDGGTSRLYHGEVELLKFTATNDDKKSTFEVKPIYTYCKKQLKPPVGTCTYIAKYATDVLGNLYKVTDNILKFEFE